jgi:CRP-like cAMP-binding protein
MRLASGRNEEDGMTGATGAAALAASKAFTGGGPADARLWGPVLQELPLFAGVSKRHVRKIAALATEARFPAGSRIVRQGGPGDAFFVILDGDAAVVRSRGLPSIALAPGDSFGEMALLDGGERVATVTAITDVELLMLHRDEFNEMLLLAMPTIAPKLLAVVGRRIRALEARQGRGMPFGV